MKSKIKPLLNCRWFRSVILTAIVVTLDFILSPVRYGFLTKPVWFFVEEVILEELLGVSDLLYFLYSYLYIGALVVPLVISVAFYSYLVGLAVWAIERKHILFGVSVLVLTGLLFSFMFIHAFQVAFSENQCDSTKSGKGLIIRSCWGEYSPLFSIPDYLYNSTEPLTQQMFDGIVMSNKEFEELKKYGGNFGYFCNTDCHIDNFQCRFDSNATCGQCIESCSQDARKRGEVSHVVDYLKSDKFLECWNRCRP